MGTLSKNINTRELAALYYAVYANIDDWTEIYCIASDKEQDKPQGIKYLASMVSRWKNSDKIQKALTQIRDQKTLNEHKQKTIWEQEREQTAESERKEKQPKKPIQPVIDYSNPENRKQLYNEVIRDAEDDPKTRLDAAKVFEQIQRDDKQAAREQKQVRSYLPLLCANCPLYQAKRAKMGK